LPPTSRIEVDLNAIGANVRALREVLTRAARGATIAPGGKQPATPGICAVLKADAYALGAPRVAKRLGIAGVDMIAVYTPEQARALVEAAVMTPILLLMPVHDLDRSDALYRAAVRGTLHFAVHDEPTLSALATVSDRQGIVLPVHLELDTGMSRGGAHPDEAMRLLSRIRSLPRMKITGVFNHLASADGDENFTREQSEAFNRWLEQARPMLPPDVVIHEANTFATFRSTSCHRSMVRVGLALLGFAGEEFADPDHFEWSAEAATLTPAVRWVSTIVHSKWIEPGTPVGYGATWRAKRRSRIGLIPIGYADGYPLALSNQARVGIETCGAPKAYVPVVGRVSMDQITVDLTDLPESQAGIGAVAEIYGNNRSALNHLPTLAKQAGTITHEMLCRMSPRLPRQYLSVEQPVRTAITGTVAV